MICLSIYVVVLVNTTPLTFVCHLLKQIRIFTNTFTLTPYNGAEALVCVMCSLFLSDNQMV